tara:strand:- start:771 stop:983 length:213 start_codon:yes stop_codon:yes gene_type:complete
MVSRMHAIKGMINVTGIFSSKKGFRTIRAATLAAVMKVRNRRSRCRPCLPVLALSEETGMRKLRDFEILV